MASALTGASVTFCPRPRGRSGCVKMPETMWRESMRCWRVGTAKRGVPKNTMFIAWRLPFAGARQLLDLADDQVLLQAAEAIDEDGALEVIHLVLEAAGEQARRFDDLL